MEANQKRTAKSKAPTPFLHGLIAKLIVEGKDLSETYEP